MTESVPRPHPPLEGIQWDVRIEEKDLLLKGKDREVRDLSKKGKDVSM